MDKVLYFNNLFTIYKELLTAKEQEIFSLYYEENLSMGEIALNKSISRSAVGNTIKIVENKLEKYESILRILEKEEKLKEMISRCENEKLRTELETLL
ncbi:TPA: DNA-binding protein [Candidatus Ventrenecus avicola]|nr:DNA-binding protein [Candidatus Ventrenecus avicola]